MANKAQVPFIIGVFFLCCFTLFSFFVDKNVFKQLDFDTTVRIQDKIPRKLDNFFSLFSDVGNFEILLILLLIILFFQRKLVAGGVTFGLFGVFHIIEIFGKIVVENPPPPHFMLRTKDMIDFPQFHVRSENSYPSGHSGRTMFLIIILIYLIWQQKNFSKTLQVILTSGLLLFALIMFISRIYLGEHWLTDVVGGILLGAALACLPLSLFSMMQRKYRT